MAICRLRCMRGRRSGRARACQARPPRSAVMQPGFWFGAGEPHPDPVIAAPANLAAIGNAVDRHIEQKAIRHPGFDRDLQFGAVFMLIAQRAADFRIRIPVMMAPPLRTRWRCSRRCSSESSGIGFAGVTIDDFAKAAESYSRFVSKAFTLMGVFPRDAARRDRLTCGQGKLCGSAQK